MSGWQTGCFRGLECPPPPPSRQLLIMLSQSYVSAGLETEPIRKYGSVLK